MKRNQIPLEQKNIVNYIEAAEAYKDTSWWEQEENEDLFWTLGDAREQVFKCYSFNGDGRLLITGDFFGKYLSPATEKVEKVDIVVPLQEYAEAVLHTCHSDKVSVIVEKYGTWESDQQYDYALVNMDEVLDFDWNNSYEFDRLVDPAIAHLKEEGRLLLFARGDYLYHIERLLYSKEFRYMHYCDPLKNGGAFIEASKVDNLTELVEPKYSPLLDHKWVRNHYFPTKGGQLFDQDLPVIDKVKEVEIDLLRELTRVCRENDITLYPIYGTLLGVIRDGGMIPGDDDIDVALMRDDFEKLKSLSDCFKDKYFLQTPYNDDCFYGGYIKLRNTQTTAIHPQNEFVDCCEGIGIDIFPIDSTYADKAKEYKKQKRIRTYQRLLYASSYGFFKRFKDMPMLKWKTYKYMGILLDRLGVRRKDLLDKLYVQMQKGDSSIDRKGIYCHYAMGNVENAKYVQASSFDKCFTLNYEGVDLSVPKGWNDLLIGFYGTQFKERIGFNEGKQRHGFYDVDVPYTVYKERFGGLKDPDSITEDVVIFGDGSLFKACLGYYKERVHITHLVLLPGEEPMDPVMGMQVEDWEEFCRQNIDKSTYRPVICSGNARAAERVLVDAGYERYFIFWYERNWMLYANQTQIWKEIQQL